MTIPSDFHIHDRPSPVTDPWQPLYVRATDAALELGFVLSTQHCNGRGMLHGGVIAALADNAMGLSLGKAYLAQSSSDQKPNIVTTNLNVDYLGAAKLGDWVCIVPRVVHIGSKSGSVDALVHAGDRLIARANASFRIIA